MSTLKSSAEHLTLNADGSGNDIKFQSNATEVAAIDQSGNLTLSGTVDGVDVAARDAILTSTTTTAGAALPKAGGTMTGQILAPAGSASAPSYAFGAQSSTGMYKPGTNQLYFSVGGTRKIRVESTQIVLEDDVSVNNTLTVVGDLTVDTNTLFVDASENKVGIGTTSPSQLLELSGATAPVIRLTDTTYDQYAEISTANAGSLILKADVGNGGTGSTYIGFEVDATERMRIDSTGAVTMPAQPAFLIGSVANQINIGASVTVVFGTEIFDQNADVNTTTFTAPVTGKYQFSGSVRVTQIDKGAAHIRVQINTSNRNYKFGLLDPDQVFSVDPLYWCFPFSALADMDAGDTAHIEIVISGGAAQTDISGSTDYTYFSGYLAC